MKLPNGYKINREIKEEKIFPKGDTFQAITEAEKYLKKNGYSLGSMQREAPIGIAKGEVYIAKWRDIALSDYSLLDGVIVPIEERNFREGGAKIIFFKKEAKIDENKKEN